MRTRRRSGDSLSSRDEADGSIRNIGFSYHGNSDMFIQILDAYDWDFCQVQYNYLDEHSQAGRRGVEFARNVGLLKEPGFASQCVECGKCEAHCPQHIQIRDMLKKADKALRPLPFKAGIAVVRKYMSR